MDLGYCWQQKQFIHQYRRNIRAQVLSLEDERSDTWKDIHDGFCFLVKWGWERRCCRVEEKRGYEVMVWEGGWVKEEI